MLRQSACTLSSRHSTHSACLKLFQVLLVIRCQPCILSVLLHTLHLKLGEFVQASGFCLVLLSSHVESFFKLAEAAEQVQRQLKQPGVSQVCHSF